MKYLLINKGITYATIEDIDVAILIQDCVNEEIKKTFNDYEDYLFELEEVDDEEKK